MTSWDGHRGPNTVRAVSVHCPDPTVLMATAPRRDEGCPVTGREVDSAPGTHMPTAHHLVPRGTKLRLSLQSPGLSSVAFAISEHKQHGLSSFSTDGAWEQRLEVISKPKPGVMSCRRNEACCAAHRARGRQEVPASCCTRTPHGG